MSSWVSDLIYFSLKEQKNLNSFFAVMFGLSNSAVQRLNKTWEVRTSMFS